MNRYGYILSAALWALGIFVVGRMIYTRASEIVENSNFEVRTAAAVVEASKGKWIVLDVRIEDQSLIIWIANKGYTATQGSGLTDNEKDDIDTTLAEATEWAMLNRNIVTVSLRFAREGIGGNVFVRLRYECLARDIAEEAAVPDCTPYQRWIEVKAKNRRFG